MKNIIEKYLIKLNNESIFAMDSYKDAPEEENENCLDDDEEEDNDIVDNKIIRTIRN